MMSLWTLWCLKSRASGLFIQPLVQAQIKENIKAPCHWHYEENSAVTGEFNAIIMSSRIYKLCHIEHWRLLPIKFTYRTFSVVIIQVSFCYEVEQFLFHTKTLSLPGCDSSLREQQSAYKCLSTAMPGQQISQNSMRETFAWIIVR